MKQRVSKILFIIGIFMIANAVIIPLISWILLFELIITEIHSYTICDMYIQDIAYWTGFLLMLPHLILNIRKDTILKTIAILFIIFWGYLFYCGQWNIAMCSQQKPSEIEVQQHDN